MVAVQRVDPSQWRDWKALRLAALRDSPDAFSSSLEDVEAYPDSLWIERAEAAATGRTVAQFLARDDDGTALGMVAMLAAPSGSPPGGSQCELVSMWTSPAARGRGVGAALVHAGLDWAVEPDAPFAEVGLWVIEGNDAAQRLYERCGFVVVEDFQAAESDPCGNEVRMLWTPA